MKRKKITTYLLTGFIAAGLVMTAPVTAYAEGTGEVGDILDNMFGGDKPEENHDYDGAPDYGDGEVSDGSDYNWGPTDSGNSDNSSSNTSNSGDSNTSTENTSGNTGSGNETQGTGNTNVSNGYHDSGVGQILDNMFGGNKPINDESYNDAPDYGHGDAASISIPVTDPTLLAVFPNAMYVYTPAGNVYFHSIDTTAHTYNIWADGVVVDSFSITDVNGATVPMTTAAVIYVNGKTYINVVVQETVKDAKMIATKEQKAAFLGLGVNGVMVNGILIEEFLSPIVQK